MLDKLLALLLAACSYPVSSEPVQMERRNTVDLPIPDEYRHDNTDSVNLRVYDNTWEVETACGDKDPNWITFACYDSRTDTMHMPNPCYYPEAQTVGTYAHLMCHEKAHKNGWRH